MGGDENPVISVKCGLDLLNTGLNSKNGGDVEDIHNVEHRWRLLKTTIAVNGQLSRPLRGALCARALENTKRLSDGEQIRRSFPVVEMKGWVTICVAVATSARRMPVVSPMTPAPTTTATTATTSSQMPDGEHGVLSIQPARRRQMRASL